MDCPGRESIPESPTSRAQAAVFAHPETKSRASSVILALRQLP
jgi:hypothetical protein